MAHQGQQKKDTIMEALLVLIVGASVMSVAPHSAGYVLNVILGLAFPFSVMMPYNGTLAVGAQLG